MMFKILWFISLVSSTCTADLLDIFSSPLRTLNSFLSIDLIDASVNEDIKLTTPELITKYGYFSEIHEVSTEDNYELTLHRITGSPKSPPRFGKPVCYLQHGLMDSSSAWVLSGPNHALAYRLADEGCDVFLGNNRGNFYSTNVINYFNNIPKIFSKNGKSYWDFSWHEIGVYDLPASIDYILGITGRTKLHYIGFSQGTTAFFVMASERPDYNDKIELMHALAPVAFLRNIQSWPVRFIESFRSILQLVTSTFGWNFVPPNPSKLSFIRVLPIGNLPIQFSSIQRAFEMMTPIFVGNSTDQLNSTLIPVIQGHTPAGASVMQLLHYGQLIKTGRFQKFDPNFYNGFDAVKTESTAPDYNLKNIHTPIALYYSNTDWLAGTADVQLLRNELPNVVKDFEITSTKFSHLDFLWGNDAPRIIYDQIVETIKEIDYL